MPSAQSTSKAARKEAKRRRRLKEKHLKQENRAESRAKRLQAKQAKREAKRTLAKEKERIAKEAAGEEFVEKPVSKLGSKRKISSRPAKGISGKKKTRKMQLPVLKSKAKRTAEKQLKPKVELESKE